MALEPVILVQNTDNKQQLNLFDITGVYSVANPGGFGSPNVTTAAIGSAFLSGEYFISNDVPPNIIPLTLLVPTEITPLPYELNESFVLTPSILNNNCTDFPDGLYILTYTLWTIGTIVFTLGGGSPNLAVGDTLTDANGNEGYVLTTNGTTTATFALVKGITITATAFTATPSTANGTISSLSVAPVSYSTTQQFLVCPGADCCIGNNLGNIDPFCDNCNKLPLDELWDNFAILMGAKAAVGCTKNNQAIDDLNFVDDWCLKKGCGCN